MSNELSRDSPGPWIAELVINIIEIPVIPCTQSPVESLKPFLVCFFLENNRPYQGLGNK